MPTATHYVTTTAGGAGVGSLGDPWTLAQAMAGAVADNVVELAAGTYHSGTTPATTRTPAWQPSNSGTAGHPIVFQGASGATIILDCNARSDSHNGSPAFGSSSSDYIHYYNLKVPDGERKDICFLGVDGCEVHECYVDHGSRTGDTTTGNYPCIYIENTINMVVEDSTFVNSSGEGDNLEDAQCTGILSFNSHNLIVRNNRVHHCGTGLEDKSSGEDNLWELNDVSDIGRNGILVANLGTPGDVVRLQFKNNVVNTADSGIKINLGTSGVLELDDFLIDGNTFWNVEKGIIQFHGQTNLKVINNIIGFTSLAYSFESATNNPPGDIWPAYNCVFRMGGGAIGNAFVAAAGAAESIVTWRARESSLNPPDTYDPSGQTLPANPAIPSDPGFSGSIDEDSDVTEFALPIGSPCRNAGLTNGTGAARHMGAYYQTGVVVGPGEDEVAEAAASLVLVVHDA